MTIYPLFSKVIYVKDIPDIFSLDYELLKKNNEFMATTFEFNQCSKSSKNRYVLDDFLPLRQFILNEFLNFKNNVFNYSSTDFEMTTSWVTKTEKGSQSGYHIHTNSYYSGILYMDDDKSPNQVGKLEFMDSNPNQIAPNNTDEFNVYNSSSWEIEPRKNLIVFFPSNLHHRITFHNSEQPRYSIAFNFFPINSFGKNDSYLNIRSLK